MSVFSKSDLTGPPGIELPGFEPPGYYTKHPGPPKPSRLAKPSWLS